MKSFTPLTEFDKKDIVAVGTDRDNSIYVLINELHEAWTYVYKYDQSTQLQHSFTVDCKFCGTTVKVTSSNLLLVSGHFSTGRVSYSRTILSNEDRNYVVVMGNERKDRLSEKTLRFPLDVTAADDRIMVLGANNNVFVFTDAAASSGGSRYSDKGGPSDPDLDPPLFKGNRPHRRLRFKCSSSMDSFGSKFLEKFPVRGDARAITFHPRSKHVIIASQTKDNRSQLHFYSKEDKFERSIDLDVEKDYLIEGSAVTTEGRICVATSTYGNKGNVLIV